MIFKKNIEFSNGQFHRIEYEASNFVIKVENYFKEIYASLYKIDRPDYEINLFNLLDYLIKEKIQVPKSNYFRNESDIEESYRKQLGHISQIVSENYKLIERFFREDNYENNVEQLEAYWRNKHPELYK